MTSRRPTDDEWDDKGARATLPVSACFVDAMADTALDSASRARTYWQAVHWAEILRSRADGPDGTSWLAQRGTIRCEIAILVDGGDDSDSTYVPSPFERETTMCYRAPRALSAHDTTYDLPP